MAATPPIPYFQTSRYRVATMVELALSKSGDPPKLTSSLSSTIRTRLEERLSGGQGKVADLGTGDGRIAIAFGQKGIETHGYEIDPNRIKLAEENIKAANLTNVFIQDKDFWQEDLSIYDIICCYPMPTIMGRLEKKLKEELNPGARVLLNYFPFLHWKEKAIKDNIYLYIK